MLLHGLFRTPRSMSIPARWLASQGYEPHNIGYPSRKQPLAELAHGLAVELERRFGTDPRRVHFLTHSMGGVVLRQLCALIAEGTIAASWKQGRAVMLAPPNQGSLLGEAVGDRRLHQFLFGEAGQEIRAVEGAAISELPLPKEVGLIAGTRSVGIYKRALRGKPEAGWTNDGTVAVNEVRVGEAPLVEVTSGHTFIMNSRDALEHAVHFFQTGKFSED